MTNRTPKTAKKVSTDSAPLKTTVFSRDAEATRIRILEAAKILFSQNSYDGIGVREIASQAKVDPALVMRYFGSKIGLFRAVAEQAFDVGDLLAEGAEMLPQNATRVLLGSLDSEIWRTGYDPLRLLLCSIGSATAGPILSEYIDKDFVAPLAAELMGEHARERATLLCANIIGIALMRIALMHDESASPQAASLQRLLKAALAAE